MCLAQTVSVKILPLTAVYKQVKVAPGEMTRTLKCYLRTEGQLMDKSEKEDRQKS